LGFLALTAGLTCMLWVGLAAGAGPKTIECKAKASETTKQIEKAVEEGGSYVLQCFEHNEIEVPTPAKNPSSELAPGFLVAKGKSVTFTAAQGTQPMFENREDHRSRIFTVAKGGSLTLNGVAVSAQTHGPAGVSAGESKTDGEKGEEGDELQIEEGKEGKGGKEGVTGAIESSAAGTDGERGTSGGIVGTLSGNAPAVQGGAIDNEGTLALNETTFDGDSLIGGSGGKGGNGGSGGAGGDGGGGGSASGRTKCDEGEGVEPVYFSNPPGAGGSGAEGGTGGAGTPAGDGAEVRGGAIYNTGTLTILASQFGADGANAGMGGGGGGGGGGGSGGSGEDGYPGGDGSNGGDAGNGAAAGDGGSAKGGSIYNTGTMRIEGSGFEDDIVQGGNSGNGGPAGNPGKGGAGGEGSYKAKCEGKNGIKNIPAEGGSGGDGGAGASGGDGANGGSGEGGAIYSTTPFTLNSSNLEHNEALAGAGARATCGSDEPCAGQGSNAAEGGQGGLGGEPPEDATHGAPGATSGANGKAGSNGVALYGETFGNIESGSAPAKPITEAVGEPTDITTTLNGTLEGDYGYEFEYNAGSSCEGGMTTPESYGNGKVSQVVYGVPPNIEYTVCLVAIDGAGSTVGNPEKFTTTVAESPPGGSGGESKSKSENESPASNGPTGFTSSSSGSTSSGKSSGSGGKDGGDEEDDDKPSDKPEGKPTTKESGGKVTVQTGETVSCPPGGSDCKAEVEVTISEEMPADASSVHKKHKQAKPKPIVIGRATLTVAPGHSEKVALTLTSQGTKLLRNSHHLSAHVSVTITQPGKAPVKSTRTIVIPAAKATGKHK
jgi:hypothetical protein